MEFGIGQGETSAAGGTELRRVGNAAGPGWRWQGFSMVGPGCRGRAGKRGCGCRESMGFAVMDSSGVGGGVKEYSSTSERSKWRATAAAVWELGRGPRLAGLRLH